MKKGPFFRYVPQFFILWYCVIIYFLLQILAHIIVTLFGSAASIQANPTSGVASSTYYNPEIDYNRINYVPPRFEPSGYPPPPNFEPPVYPSNLESPAYPPQAYKPPGYIKSQYKPKQNCSVQDEIIIAEICTPTFQTLARTI